MKTLKSLMMACLALTVGFASCNKADETPIVDASGTKTVMLKISKGTVDLRSVSEAIGSVPVTFTSGHLYFVSASGQITKHMAIVSGGGNSDSQVEVGDLESTSGALIENVPANSEQVYFAGNAPSGVTVPTFGNIDAVKNVLLNVETQSDASGGVSNASLYGMGQITPGNPATANFNVAPIASRIELAKLTATGVITGFKVDGIFINNYYAQSGLDGIPVPASLINNGSDATKYMGGSAEYPGMMDGILYDYNASGMGMPTPKVWAYNVFAGAPTPHIVIRLSDIVTSDDSSYPSPQFLTVKGFRDLGGDLLAAFQGGKAYKISDLSFNQNNLTELPELSSIEVEVKVTLIPWETIEVTPEL